MSNLIPEISQNSAITPRRAAHVTCSNQTSLQEAFTLIELLVSLAVIALLAAIIFPAFSKAKEKARQATCLSNIRQIGLAMMMYTGDYDEGYPQANANGTPATWDFMIAPYLGDRTEAKQTFSQRVADLPGVFNCPSFLGPEQQFNYGVTSQLFPTNRGVLPAGLLSPTFKLSDVRFPTTSVIIAEKGRNNGAAPGVRGVPSVESSFPRIRAWNITSGDPTPYWVNPDGSDASISPLNDSDSSPPCVSATTCGHGAATPRYRHDGTVTVLFADGHVKSMPRGSLGGKHWGTYIHFPVL